MAFGCQCPRTRAVRDALGGQHPRLFKPGSEPLKMLSNEPKPMLPGLPRGLWRGEARRLPVRRGRLHSCRMATRRPADSTPDLFASLPPAAKTPGAPERLPVQQSKPQPNATALRPRHLLPKDLAGALKRLDETELDALLAAATAELRRRGRPAPTIPAGKPTAAAMRPRGAAADVAAPSLTTGKLNAVRAAFKAGVRPSVIARQFGISQADVKNALAAQKSGR
jgi:predicted DNA-binding protein (UPF0251 family)